MLDQQQLSVRTKLQTLTRSTAFGVLTFLCSLMSLISLVQHIFKIGLSRVSAQYLGYFRLVSHFVFGGIPALLGIQISQTVVDVWALSFIGAGAYLQTPGIEGSRAFSSHGETAHSLRFRLTFLLAAGFSGLGLFFIFAALSPMTYADDFHREPLDLFKGTAKNLMIILGAMVLFFAFNAYAPSAP